MKTYKKLIIFLGVMVLCLPFGVKGATLEMGEITKESNTATIPVILRLNEGETAAPIKGVSCKTDYDGVTCSVSNTKENILTLLGTEKDGDEVAKISVVNDDVSQASGVIVTLRYEQYDVKSNKINIGPKVPDEPESTNPKLKAIKVSSGKINPAFDPDVQNYTIYDISDTVNSIIFDYDCQDKNCSIKLDGGANVSSTRVTLNQGENTIKLTSTAEDGITTVNYTFTVFRGETSFNSAKLKSLVIGEYELSPSFKSDKFEYTATVPYALVTLATAVTYEAEDESAKVEITGHDNLVVGENTIEIKVTNALETETKTYKIVVTRLDNQDIIVKAYKDGKIKFINGSNEDVELTEEEFKKQYPNEWTKIENKTYEFDENGNIVVKKAEDATNNKEEKKKSKAWIVILIIVLGIAIIGVSGYFIFRKKPEPKDKNNKDNKQKKEVIEDTEAVSEDKVEQQEEDEMPKEVIDEEDDLLNLSDSTEEIEINIKRNNAKDIDYALETEIESVEHTASKRNLDDTIDIDEALSDLMNTKQYNFRDDDEK